MIKGLIPLIISIVLLALSLWGMVGILHIQQLTEDELFWRLLASCIGMAGSLVNMIVISHRRSQ